MRPIRTILSACLLALATVAPALETPLILPAGTNAGIIDPSLGTLTTIEVISNGSTRKAFVNWLMDLDQRQRRPVAEINGEVITELRQGSETIRPSAEEFTRIYPDKATKAQTDAGQKDLRAQVREAEKAFWEQEHKYDGVVRGAYSGQYLMLVIPSTRAVLFYQNSGKESLDLIGWSQYSPLLYVPSAWKSTPDPAQFVQSLGKLDEDEKKAIEGALHAREDGSAAAAAKSDIWCTNIGESFIVVDSANQKIWAYEIKGQTVAMTSVRSMGVDLIAPGFHTLPLDQNGIELFAKLYAGQLKDLGIAKLDWPYVQAFISAQQVGDATKAGALQANLVGSQVVLNFTAQRKIVSYEYRQGAGLNLTTVRDTTVDLGLTLLARQISEKTLARNAYNEAVKSKGTILGLITYALGLDPSLIHDAEKNAAIKKALNADWEKLKADAVKAEEVLKSKRDAIEAAAEAERKRLKEKKKK